MVDQPTTRRMTAQEFLNLLESDEQVQLIDGALIMARSIQKLIRRSIQGYAASR